MSAKLSTTDIVEVVNLDREVLQSVFIFRINRFDTSDLSAESSCGSVKTISEAKPLIKHWYRLYGIN